MEKYKLIQYQLVRRLEEACKYVLNVLMA